MTTDPPTDDHIASAICSGSTYEKVRYQRHAFLRQSVPRTLMLQSALLGLLVALLPMYGLFPASVAGYLPATDPSVASPKVLLLGVFGGLLELLGATLLVGTALYRVRRAPLTESQAHTMLDVEDFARYVGLGTGGLAILLTVCVFAVGLGGGAAVDTYVGTAGANPFVASGFGLPIVAVSLVAFVASVVLFYAGGYLSVRLSQARRRGN
ncbi:hypothetical protein [Haloarcula salinisoli]|uniref:Uncharacterized protein n=1 Tax=Haloarcula salinisoli TaxID=2487746 RepID=A0A8J8C8E0_9EURY|nr:hypothetical protein [Halomicroarcula salinisoli]MBX0287015.1 hypothetical protein [Halomicroarcula salinisoli]MBX0304316.1 hypothetical protein [Halomicroarcula salinisoli]